MSTRLHVDMDAALARMGNRVPLYQMLFDSFCEKQPATPSDIRGALERGELAEAARIAHSCKSLAANVGILTIQDTAKDLEEHLYDKPALTEQEVAEVGQLLSQLSEQFTDLAKDKDEILSALEKKH